MEHFIYIIYSYKAKKFYTGITTNIGRRLKEHVKQKYKDLQLVHCEVCESRIEARKLEKFFKSGFGREIRREIFLTR